MLLYRQKNKYISIGSLNPDDEYIYRVKKIYQKDVEYINALLLNETRVGIIFRNKDRIRDSISAFNNREDTKQKVYFIRRRTKQKLVPILSSNSASYCCFKMERL